MPPPYCYEYPRPAVTVDLGAYARGPDGFRLLMIRRKHDPFAGKLALPGGFVEMDETTETAARRELQEETGLALDHPLHFLGVWGDPGRDPRGRTFSLVYTVALASTPSDAAGADDAEEALWVDSFRVKDLAFDHDDIVTQANRWLVGSLTTTHAGLAFLPQTFQAEDVSQLLKDLQIPRRALATAVERFLALPGITMVKGQPGVYRRKLPKAAVSPPGRPRRGSRTPENGG